MKHFMHKNIQSDCRGSMLMEMLLGVALAAVAIPFIFQYQKRAITRAENMAVVRRMEMIENALELYIVDNRDMLLNTVGRNITRVQIDDLVPYGVSDAILANSDQYQIRVLKSSDTGGRATLQGVVVLADADITPIRTREIVSLGGANMGFIEGAHAYGTFGAWHSDTIDLGVGTTDGIVGMTSVNRDNALYLWRAPSANEADATMMAGLNLGGHDIKNAKFFDATSTRFGENLSSQTIVASNVVFQNRTTIDRGFETVSATVAGALSSDSRSMEIAGGFRLSDLAKFSSFTVDDLWVSNLTLGGLSVSTDDNDIATLKINQSLDMTAGRITAVTATVGFAGSVTPRLNVRKRVEDSVNPNYFWDAASGVAHFSDISFPELNRMATLIVQRESANSTVAGQLFGAVATNKNATAADFMNAITEIQNRVRAKYSLLNLE